MPVPDHLLRLHNLIQVSHSATSRNLVYSKVTADDTDGADGAANWSLHVVGDKEWFEREWREDELGEDEFVCESIKLTINYCSDFDFRKEKTADPLALYTGDATWKSFVDRFERAFIAGEIHAIESSNGREFSLTVDNTSDNPITIVLTRVSVNVKNENNRSLLLALALDVQKRGCVIGAENTVQGKYAIKTDWLRNCLQWIVGQNLFYPRECERLRRTLATQSAGILAKADGGTGTQTGLLNAPKFQTAAKAQVVKRKKGRSLVNPRGSTRRPRIRRRRITEFTVNMASNYV
ncbi:hypothetical protein BC937DRAFT_89476 [Endogone sp. FLAS-F59071]|nr:hypothetical protein BC937DRAFT_89476 [Endogone sp. FLAS-F59071]|eukprot:RUS17803.1 hypothetical protein BC937DRAFT_89476 [Endogone sp. FLAS-F59071]